MPAAASSFPLRAHGANPEKLYAASGIPMPDRVIDFSTNTNALPWRGDFSKIDLHRCLAFYPDDEATELRAKLAGRNGCAPENVLVVNGSNEAVYLVASLLAGRRAAVLQPVYGEYLRALSGYGVETRNVFKPGELSEADALFLCNPCNPTGAYIESAELEALFARHPHTLFLVDEAYIDFLTGEDRRLDFLRHGNVVILRSLTKVFHLCGARVGYVLASEERIARLKARQPTWSVNALAQEAALTFLDDEEFVRRTRAFYAEETPRFMTAIQNAGFEVRPTRTNFFLIEVADDRQLIRFLLERGLVVRHTRNFPGLDGRCIRVATRLPEENDSLVRALRDYGTDRRLT